MVRRYGDPVEVRSRAGGGSCEPTVPPDSFLWRGRLYVVRSVLGHWRERRAWWNEPAARAVHGEADRAGSSTVPGGADGRNQEQGVEPEVGGPGAGRSEVGESEVGDLGRFAVEREVWRVEASAGRHVGVGVYDLCQGPVSRWSLLRVAD